jgi:hypothetical protein
MKDPVLLVRTQIQGTRGILDMKQMGLKLRAGKLTIHFCFYFSPVEEHLVDRLDIGCSH